MLERARAAAQRLTRRQRSGPAARRRGDGAPADAHTIQAHFASLIEVQRALISTPTHFYVPCGQPVLLWIGPAKHQRDQFCNAPRAEAHHKQV